MKTPRQFDVIVVGLGTAGASTCMELARRGDAVLGLDAFSPPHRRGSHHGESRSIRKAYMEGTAYVPMAFRSWELWRKLEQQAGTTLLVKTENLTIGPQNCPAVSGFLKSARAYDIPHELMTASAVRSRWPQLAVPESFVAGLEIDAGILYPEPAVRTFLEEAQRFGAVLNVNEPLLRWDEQRSHIRVMTPSGMYEGGRLLLAAGAHNQRLMPNADDTLSIKRVPVFWASPPGNGSYNLGSFPVNFWQIPHTGENHPGYSELYALPCMKDGGMVKVAPHNELSDIDPSKTAHPATEAEITRIRGFIAQFIPELNAQHIFMESCLYTLTPDRHFWLGPLPGYQRVFIAALSGHGFKFAPVLGEILSDMLEGRNSPYDLNMFHPDRPATHASTDRTVHGSGSKE